MDDYPEEIGMWTIENYQRNQIEKGLKDCKDDDIIMISDLDEIPDPRELKNIFEMKELDDKIIGLKLINFRFYMNYYMLDKYIYAPKIVLYKNYINFLKNKENSNYIDNIIKTPNVNVGPTLSKLRYYTTYNDDKLFKYKKIAGWQFTWLGGFDKYVKKHLDICEGHDTVKDNIEKSKKVYEILTKGGIYQQSEFHNKPIYHVYIKLDDFYPKYILDNIDKYKHLFNHLDDKNLKSIKYYDSKFFSYFILKPKVFLCKYILSHPLIIKTMSIFIFNKQKRKDFRYVMFRKYVNEDYFDKKNK